MENKQATSSLAMAVTLISFGMLFATLFLIYALIRGSSQTWPPEELKAISLYYPIFSSIAIVLSSIALYTGQKKIKADYFHTFKYWLLISLLLGVGFLVGQTLLWKSLSNIGIYSSSGIIGSLIYGFTWIHAAHAILCLIALL